MMGRTHALTGFSAGAAVAPHIGLHRLAEVLTFATVTAGYALLPDLDHPSASASKSLGPLTGGFSRILRWSSHVTYEATKGPKDEAGPGTHRHLTHTAAFAAALGAATWYGTRAGGAWATFGVLLFGILLAQMVLGPPLRRLGKALGVLKRKTGSTDHLLIPLGGVAAALVSTSPAWHQALQQASGQIGISVALGCIVHCVGDSLTESGCPVLWPIPIAGETWYELRPPAFLRFRTSGPVERLIAPIAAIAAVLLLSGIRADARDPVAAGKQALAADPIPVVRELASAWSRYGDYFGEGCDTLRHYGYWRCALD